MNHHRANERAMAANEASYLRDPRDDECDEESPECEGCGEQYHASKPDHGTCKACSEALKADHDRDEEKDEGGRR